MKKYSKEFKDSTVQLIINNNESVAQIGKDLDVHPKTLYEFIVLVTFFCFGIYSRFFGKRLII